MHNKVHEFLLKKYSIPPFDDDSQLGVELCTILYRLNKNKKLDDRDKKWIQDKNMSKLYRFIENWEKTGKANIYNLHKSHSFPYKNYIAPNEEDSAIMSQIPNANNLHKCHIAPNEEDNTIVSETSKIDIRARTDVAPSIKPYSRTKINEHLLKKYCIPQMGDYNESYNVLCSILRRLNKNKKLDHTDKKWLQDKNMSKLYRFIENWEKTGKANFYNLHKSHSFPYKNYIAPNEEDSAIVSQMPNIDIGAKTDVLPSIKSYSKTEIDEYLLEKNRILQDLEGKPDIDILYDPIRYVGNTKNGNKSKQSTSNPRNDSNSGKHIKKSRMSLYYTSEWLSKHIKSKIEKIVPSNIPENVSSIVPEKIWTTMKESIQKDIEELVYIYKHRQWTATATMAGSLLEKVLNTYIKDHLKEDTVKNLGEAIEKLKNDNYLSSFIKEMDEHRELRNTFAHGKKRAGTEEAKKSIIYFLSITIRIHNKKP